jgi:hypothetical protein
MANNVVLFGKISQKKIKELFKTRISETLPSQLRKLITDKQVGIEVAPKVKQDFIELYRGEIGNEELGMLVFNILSFCDEITIIPNGRLEEAVKQSKPVSKPTGLGLELEGDQ